MRRWMIGASVLLAAGTVRAEATGVVYASVEGWEISGEPPARECVMQHYYRSKDEKKIEGLTILYSAEKEGVLVVWSNDWMTYLPAKGELDLGLAFRKGGPVDQSWENRSLHYDKVGKDYLFTRAFVGPEQTRRILADLSESDHMGWTLGPTLLTSIPLDASKAVEKLRECSLNGGKAP